MTTAFSPRNRWVRLAAYLEAVDAVDRQVASSIELATLSGMSPEQVRRDMAWLRRLLQGQRFGRQGVGYDLPGLRTALRKALRVETPRKVAVVGAGGEEEKMKEAIGACPYFRLVDPAEAHEADFILLSGRDHPEEAPRGVLVLCCSEPEPDADEKEPVRGNPIGVVRLLLAASAALWKKGQESL